MFLYGLIGAIICTLGGAFIGGYFGAPDAGLFIGTALGLCLAGGSAYAESRSYK